MTFWVYPIKELKRAPRSFKCSTCRGLIEQGSMYVKTNYGRYCVSCGRKVPTAEQAAENLRHAG